MAGQQVCSVFCYAFKPMLPMNAMDGGFTVNLYTDHQLVFNTYDHNGYCTSETRFQLNDYTTSRYLRMVEYARPWLNNMPSRMRGYEGCIDGEYSFGFNGLQLCRVENLQSLVTGDFRDAAAHYARKLFCLMEDISTMLGSYGIDFKLDQFSWSDAAPELVPPVQNLYQTYA